MARTSSIMWDMFVETGNIDIYLKYKRHSRLKEQKGAQKCPTVQLKSTQS